MADKPVLRPVPYENGSYYRLKDKKLIVVVRNFGKDCDKETTTQVDFGGYGTCIKRDDRAPQVRPTKPLAAGESETLEFDCPSDDCFDPDCEFYICVDVENVLEEDPTTRNNVTRGICRKPMVPYLVVIPNDKGDLLTREGEQLKFIVQNQGTAYARSSITKIETETYPEIKVETPEFEPGHTREISVEMPKGKAVGKGSKYRISLDIEGVLHVPDERNRRPRRPYQGQIK
jgi:hypothetical protein